MADGGKTVVGLCLLMAGLATAGYFTGNGTTLVAVVVSVVGIGFVCWGETHCF